jgi:integral membrane sensor domain MASE1
MKHCRKQLEGIGFALLLALLLATLLRGTQLESSLPILFLGILVFVAFIFGSSAGILSTLGAAVIFATCLFDPVLSVRIGDKAQRSNVIWMTVGGISLSELLGSRPKNRLGPGT